MTDENVITEIDSIINEFSKLVENPGDPSSEKGNENLWYSWRFLQIYTTWGLRLPHTEALLKAKLGVSDPASYKFFSLMEDGYNQIYNASTDFKINIFPEVIDVGLKLLDFAEDADPNNGEVFNVLIELIEDDETGDAIDLINDLRETANENTEKAKELITKLNTYRTSLDSAQIKVNEAKSSVAADERVSQTLLDKLTGGKDVPGSIEHWQKLLDEKEDEYDHNVVVASTTVTYAWVIPIGAIAGVVVAGVYGDKAVKALKRMEEMEDEISKLNAEKKTAFATNRIQDMAITSLAKASKYTDMAIQHTNAVQNAWTGVSGNLDYISNKVNKMTKESDNVEILKSKALVKNYAKNAGKKWALLVPSLKALTHDPYIVVEDEEKSIGEVANEMSNEPGKSA